MEQKSDKQPGEDQTAHLLQEAAKSGNTGAVGSLIQNAGAYFNINRQDDVNGKMPLYWAVNNGHLKTTRVLLSLGADVNGLSYLETEDMEEPPLITAVRQRDIPMVRLLLRKGANANLQTSPFNKYAIFCYVPSRTAIQYAIGQPNVNLVKILLRGGARPDLQREYGHTALDWAVASWFRCINCTHRLSNIHDKQSRVLQLLCDSKKFYSDELSGALYRATTRIQCVEKAEILLNAGGDLDFYGYSYWNETALHMAARRNNSLVARFLVNNGANLNMACTNGESPLAVNIRFCKSSEIATMLIIHGASLDVKDTWKRPLIVACIGVKNPLTCSVLCRQLVVAGCKVPKTYQRPHPRKESRVEELCDWLEFRRRNPQRLDDLSRICVRKFLSKKVVKGKSIVQTVRKMENLPKVIVDYLLLKDLVVSQSEALE